MCDHDDGENRKGNNGEASVQAEQRSKLARDHEQRGHEHDGALRNKALNAIDIRCGSRHQLAGVRAIVTAERKRLDAGAQVVAQAKDDAVRNADGECTLTNWNSPLITASPTSKSANWITSSRSFYMMPRSMITCCRRGINIIPAVASNMHKVEPG